MPIQNQQATTPQSNPPLMTNDPAHDLDTPRYDAETVQQIIALAGQMQIRHRETLSEGEIVALGREVGVQPQFVRRALAEVESPPEPLAKSRATPVGTTGRTAARVAPITRQQWTVAGSIVVVSPLLAFVLRFLPFPVMSLSLSQRLLIIFLVLSVFLAFCTGVLGKSKRVGAVCGGVLGLLTMVPLFVFIPWKVDTTPAAIFSTMLVVLSRPGVFFVVGGALLGMSGAVVRKVMRGPRRRLRIVVE